MNELSEGDATKRDLAYHYTSAETALTHILPTGRILLTPVASANDPWEIRPVEGGVAYDRANLSDLRTQLSNLQAFVLRARRACFCLNDPSREETSGSSRWGWARDRMWAQYAADHQGVCLCFDRQRLIAAFHSALASRGDCLAEPVHYTDESELPPFDADAAARTTGNQYLRNYRRANARARYFRKRLDWSAETEFRLLVLEDEPNNAPAYVPITGGVLVGVTAGCRFQETSETLLGDLCLAAQVPASRIVYTDIPRLNPYGPSSLDKFKTPW